MSWRETSLYLCTASLYLCTASLHLCTTSLYLCSATLYLCTASLYLCTTSLYLDKVVASKQLKVAMEMDVERKARLEKMIATTQLRLALETEEERREKKRNEFNIDLISKTFFFFKELAHSPCNGNHFSSLNNSNSLNTASIYSRQLQFTQDLHILIAYQIKLKL